MKGICGKKSGLSSTTLRVLLAHLRRILRIPFDCVVLAQHHDVALALALVRLLDEDGKDELVQVEVELLLGAVVAQLVKEASCVLFVNVYFFTVAVNTTTLWVTYAGLDT